MDAAQRDKLIDTILAHYICVAENGALLPPERWNATQRGLARHAATLYLDHAVGLQGIMHGIARPMVMVVHPNQLRSGNGYPIEFEDTDDGIRMHVSMLADGLEGHVRRALADRFKKVEETEPTAHSERIKKIDLIPQPRDRDVGRSFDHHGYRSTYDILGGPEKERERRNTWGDLNAHKRLKKDNPALIDYYRDQLFSPEIMNKQSPKDWLRSLRILEGISTKEMGIRLSSGQRQYSWWENNSRLTLRYPLQIITRNILDLPTVEIRRKDGTAKTIVDPAYARKFLDKFGYDASLYPNPVRMVEKAVEKLLDEFEHGKITFNDLPTLGEMVGYLLKADNNPQYPLGPAVDIKKSSDNLRAHKKPLAAILGISETSPLFLLPTKGVRGEWHLDLSPQHALAAARAHAGNAGEFLRFYRQWSGGKSPEDIKDQLGVHRQRVYQMEELIHISPSICARILEKNAYGFPTDATGAVAQEVQAILRAFAKPRRGQPKRQDAERNTPSSPSL